MPRSLLTFFLALILCAFVGCAARNKKPNSSAHVYEGEAPTNRYSDAPEAAGGPITPF